MAGQARIVITGTLGGDPEIREVGAASVASFSVAVSERTKQGDQWVDGNTTWYRCSAWRDLGTNIAASFHKGDRVIIDGTIGERKYTDREGNEKSSWEVTVEEIGASVRFATVSISRAGGGGGRAQQAPRRPDTRQSTPQQQDGWSLPAYDDNTPF